MNEKLSKTPQIRTSPTSENSQVLLAEEEITGLLLFECSVQMKMDM